MTQQYGLLLSNELFALNKYTLHVFKLCNSLDYRSCGDAAEDVCFPLHLEIVLQLSVLKYLFGTDFIKWIHSSVVEHQDKRM